MTDRDKLIYQRLKDNYDNWEKNARDNSIEVAPGLLEGYVLCLTDFSSIASELEPRIKERAKFPTRLFPRFLKDKKDKKD